MSCNNEFLFREDNQQVIFQQFDGNVIIKGFTDKGCYKFEYEEFKEECEQ